MQKCENGGGELFVWTDIDPKYEHDFNRWYDREHMEERLSIPGFQWARRYRAVSDAERRYLALYRVAGKEVFTSKPYQEAFAHQTAWSQDNFARMRNTQRRVFGIPQARGQGTGGAVGLLRIGTATPDHEAVNTVFAALEPLQGALGMRWLEPDVDLSTPLPSEEASRRVLEACLVLEANSVAAAEVMLGTGLEASKLKPDHGAVFRLMWELRAEDVKQQD